MVVIRNINNDVSLCAGSRGQEVIVFGKAAGFVKPPQEIPLSKIQRISYDINEQCSALLVTFVVSTVVTYLFGLSKEDLAAKE